MNQTDLVAALDYLDVDPRAYSLGEGARIEQYCLEDQRSRWCVFYSERGLRTDEHFFPSEEEACAWLFQIIERDPTTRRERWRQ